MKKGKIGNGRKRERDRDRVGNREKETERYKAREITYLTVRRKRNRGKKIFP